MKVFFDTYGFIGWANPSDSAYVRVGDWLSRYHGRFLTTEWVLMELADALSTRRDRPKGLEIIRRVRANRLFEIVPYDTTIYQAGYDLFAARPDKDWSLTDCISFVVMARRGLTEALTGDRHFEQAGFQAIFKV
jgi:uncharacterized protein